MIPERPSCSEIIFDDIPYLWLDWNATGILTFELAQQILESGETFDRIVTLAKGGWSWTRALADYLAIDSISSMRFQSYSGINQKLSKPQVTEPLAIPATGQRILFFDEVVDSGESVKSTQEYLYAQGATLVKSATLCYKPRSIIRPDFFALETSAWVIYPHEIREFTTQAGTAWLASGLSPKAVLERFATLGLPTDQVTYFLAPLT